MSKDILTLAREAGFMPTVLNHWPNELERLAALVRADEREALVESIDWTALMRQGGLVTWGDAEELGDRVVAAIRARGDNK